MGGDGAGSSFTGAVGNTSAITSADGLVARSKEMDLVKSGVELLVV